MKRESRAFARLSYGQKSEQTADHAVIGHVDALRGGNLRQTGHGHDITGEHHDEAGTGGHLHVLNGYGEVFRCAQFGGIIGEAVLGLGHADGNLSKPSAVS